MVVLRPTQKDEFNITDELEYLKCPNCKEGTWIIRTQNYGTRQCNVCLKFVKPVPSRLQRWEKW